MVTAKPTELAMTPASSMQLMLCFKGEAYLMVIGGMVFVVGASEDAGAGNGESSRVSANGRSVGTDPGHSGTPAASAVTLMPLNRSHSPNPTSATKLRANPGVLMMG